MGGMEDKWLTTGKGAQFDVGVVFAALWFQPPRWGIYMENALSANKLSVGSEGGSFYSEHIGERQVINE